MRAIARTNQAEEGKAAQKLVATKKRARKLLTPVLMAVLVFFLLGAGGQAAELKKFTLGYSTVGPAGTGLWMAKEMGTFEKYGIDAELIFISAGPIVVQRC